MFTLKNLEQLRTEGKEVGIFSKEINKRLKNYTPKDFSNFNKRSYYYWISEERATPLRVVIKLMRKEKLKKIQIDYFSAGGGNKITFPEKLNKNLSYVLGLILGDGYLILSKEREKRRTYGIQISFKEIKKAKEIKEITHQLFGINPSIYSGKGCFNLCIFSKPLSLILNKIFQVPFGKKYRTLTIPKKIKSSNGMHKKLFIKGVFDSDGNIYNYRGKKAIQLRQKSFKFLKEIKDLLEKMNLEFNRPYRDRANNSWVLWTSKKQLVDNFIKKIINLELRPR